MFQASGLSRERLTRVREMLGRHVGPGNIPGLVAAVERRGDLHVEVLGSCDAGGSRPMRRDTIFRIASLTKLVTAVAAMILVEEGRLRLDEPVDAYLPELADRQVLKSPDGALDDTVPASRPITLRDLLTLRCGLGAVMAFPPRYPIQRAMMSAHVAPSAHFFQDAPDEFMKRLGALPLVHQPGEGWLYHTGFEIAGVLIARAVGRSLGAFMRERIFEPLEMTDTGFFVPPEKISRLADCYHADPSGEGIKLFDPADGGLFSRQPAFEAGGGGLVSTVDDYLAFCRMLLDGGRAGAVRILSRPSLTLMTSDHLTAGQKEANPVFFHGNSGWGFGTAVDIRRDHAWMSSGRFGWTGGHGTTAYVDPSEELIGILFTQRLMESPEAPPAYVDFWNAAYQAIDD